MLRGSFTRPAFLATFALALLAIGCSGDPTSTATTSGTAAQTQVAAPPLMDLVDRIQAAYDNNFKSIDPKVAPVEKAILDGLKKGADVKPLLTKNHQLFTDSVEGAKQATLDISNSTTNEVSVKDHEAYVAFFTALGARATARSNEYKAFLDYEAKPNDDNKKAVLTAATAVKTADDYYADIKSGKKEAKVAG